MTTKPSARILADSISLEGHRLTTMEVVMHRFVLAEFNTHRVASRNSASSRAIPVEKQLDKVESDPAWPIVWPREQPGMQGGSDLEGYELQDAFDLFRDVHDHTVQAISTYLELHPEKKDRLHKSLINRLLEPFMWHTVVCSWTELGNFFNQRCSPLAQPEIHAAADAMLEAYEASVPRLLLPGDWHMPFIRPEDRDEAQQLIYSEPTLSGFGPTDILKRVSVARCARTSYLTHNGTRSLVADIELFNKLASADPWHASPAEHVATPALPDEATLGNFRGYHQFRHFIELAMEVQKDGG